MNKREIKYHASNGEHDIYGLIYEPGNTNRAKGILQISHGMCEHSNRYDEFARFMVKHQFIVCINDHAGHGKSRCELYGYMGAKDGYKNMAKDMHKLHVMMKHKYTDLPYFLLGHSMGSFLARYYAVHFKYGLDGVIYSGTGDPQTIANVGLILAKIMIKLEGAKAEGRIFDRLTKTMYNARIEPKRTSCDWLTTDTKIVDKFMQDKACQFAFTYGGYLDLFSLIKEISGDDWARNVSKDIPTYIFSGGQDPVGNYGQDCHSIYEKLLAAGCTKVELKIYPEGRHEMLNEVNRQEVYKNILAWMNNHEKVVERPLIDKD